MPPDLRLDCIAPSMIGEAWWWLEPLIHRLVKRAHGEFTAEGLKSQAESGNVLVWVVSSPTQPRAPLATLLTRFVDWSGETVCRVIGMAGDLAAFEQMMPESFERAKRMGASRIVFEGRTGWRLLKQHGFREIAVVMEKRLDG